MVRPSGGYWRSKPSCTGGLATILTAGLTICITLVADPAFLLVAWDRVRHNKGAKTAGVDGQTAYYVEGPYGQSRGSLSELRAQLKDRSFTSGTGAGAVIPQSLGQERRRGIATVTDRVVQASST